MSYYDEDGKLKPIPAALPNNTGSQCSAIELEFARQYAATLSPAGAARAAGYVGKSPGRFAATLLTRPPVQWEIAKIRKDSRKRHDAIVDWLVRELASLAGASLGDIVQDDGDLKPLSSVDREVQTTLAEYVRTPTKDGTAVKVKQHDKLKAIQMLCRIFGLERTVQEVSLHDPNGQPAHVAAARAAIERAVLPPMPEPEAKKK